MISLGLLPFSIIGLVLFTAFVIYKAPKDIMTPSSWGLLAWAVIGVPVATGVVVELNYFVADMEGGFRWLPDWLYLGILVTCLLSGAVSIIALPVLSLPIRILLTVPFLISMFFLLFVILLNIACANGDCL